jgi:phage repressor protein C with HTH and peptisase S24 domain
LVNALRDSLPDGEGFQERIRIRRKTLGLTQEQIGNMVGVTIATVQSWEKNAWPNTRYLIPLAEALKCSPEWLLKGGGQKNEGEGGKDFYRPSLIEPRLNSNGDMVIKSEEKGCLFAFSREWLTRYVSRAENALLLKVQGNSMQRTLENGDYIMLDRGRTQIVDGCMYALSIGSGIVIRKLELLVNEKVRIISDNRKAYPPYEALREELHIIGQVVWISRFFTSRVT